MYIACLVDNRPSEAIFTRGGPEACSPGKFLNFGSLEMAFP